MRSKKVLWGIVVFLTILVHVLTLTFTYKDIAKLFRTEQDPLDVVYEYNEKEISVRKLFEASYEKLHYSSHWSATGISDYKVKDVTDTNGKMLFTPITNKSLMYDLTYEHYYIDEDNYMWTLNGNYTNSTNYYLYDHGDFDNQSMIASYNFYEGKINGKESSAFEYTGHKFYSFVNVEKLLMPDFDNMSDVSVDFDGHVNEQGHIVVKFEGNYLPCIASAFGEDRKDTPYNDVIYTFDADTMSIISIKLRREDEYTVYNTNKLEKITHSLEFSIVDKPGEDCNELEIPEVICENSLINGVITGNGSIKPSSTLRNDASDKNDLSSTISSIWKNTITAMSDDSCTVDELSDSLSDNASKYGMDIKKKGYFINEKESFIFVKYSVFKEEQEIFNIVMPFVVYGAQLYNENNLLISTEDEVAIYDSGCVWIYHEINENITARTCYLIYDDGKLTLDHKITREEDLSNLLDTEELSLFSYGDFAELRTFATDFSKQVSTYIEKYEVFGDGQTYVYYVINENCYTDDLYYIYDIPFSSPIDAYKDEDEFLIEDAASWQEFS